MVHSHSHSVLIHQPRMDAYGHQLKGSHSRSFVCIHGSFWRSLVCIRGYLSLQITCYSRSRPLNLGTTLFLASQFLFQGPGPGRILAALFLSRGTPGCSLGGLPLFQDLYQSAERDLTIDKLGPRIPGRYPDTGDSVQQCGCCLDFVNVLTTRAAGACKYLFKILRLQTKPVNPFQQRRIP